jgi:hypothetical protein
MAKEMKIVLKENKKLTKLINNNNNNNNIQINTIINTDNSITTNSHSNNTTTSNSNNTANSNNTTTSNSNNTANNTANTANNTANNYIFDQGKEDMSHITDEFKMSLIKNPESMIQKLIKKIYFDPDKPRNHNIRYPNIRSNNFVVYKYGKWVHEDKNTTIHTMLDTACFVLEEYYNSVESSMDVIHQQKMNKFMRLYAAGDEEQYKTIKTACEYVVLNNR